MALHFHLRRRRHSPRAALAPAAAVLVLAFAPAVTTPAGAAEVTAANAAFTGTAIASGAFVPLNVNPNVQLYPAYSFSETYNDSSHSLSGGVYPGFLVDAAAQFYGYGPEARTTFGIAESQWPNPPQKVDAGFTNFGDKCGFLSVDFGFPDSFVDTCRAYWAQWGDYFPAHTATASAKSAASSSAGSAQGAGLVAPAGVVVGHFETTTSTALAADGRSVTSTATTVLNDVQIGPLVIQQIRSVATSVSGGNQAAAKSTHELHITGASFGPLHDPVTIDGNGVHDITDAPTRNLNAQLAPYGFDVRTIAGGSVVTPSETTTDSGALVVQWSGSPPEPLRAPTDQLCNASQQAGSMLGAGQHPVDIVESNPLRQQNPVSQTINPVTNRPLYDPNAKPFTLVDPTVDVHETLPPVLPCLDFLLARNVNVGFALGSAFADATYQPLTPVDFEPAGLVPFDGGSFSSTLTIPGFDAALNPIAAVPVPSATPRTRRITTVTSSELPGNVAGRVELVYGVLALLAATLLIGRRAFALLIRL